MLLRPEIEGKFPNRLFSEGRPLRAPAGGVKRRPYMGGFETDSRAGFQTRFVILSAANAISRAKAWILHCVQDDSKRVLLGLKTLLAASSRRVKANRAGPPGFFMPGCGRPQGTPLQ